MLIGLPTEPKARRFVINIVVAFLPSAFLGLALIKLINAVDEAENNFRDLEGRLKVVFLPDFNVKNAQSVYPAADLSEQISTAGKEASGTGNMKFAMNGALTIGTLDGANIEMKDEVGSDNIFIFGLTAEEVVSLQAKGYNPWDIYYSNAELKRALNMIAGGYFSPGAPDLFRPVFDALLRGGDHFLLLADYASYIACQERIDELFKNPEEWTRRAILNVAGMGKFSSDRAIREYAEKIWNVKAVEH